MPVQERWRTGIAEGELRLPTCNVREEERRSRSGLAYRWIPSECPATA